MDGHHITLSLWSLPSSPKATPTATCKPVPALRQDPSPTSYALPFAHLSPHIAPMTCLFGTAAVPTDLCSCPSTGRQHGLREASQVSDVASPWAVSPTSWHKGREGQPDSPRAQLIPPAVPGMPLAYALPLLQLSRCSLESKAKGRAFCRSPRSRQTGLTSNVLARNLIPPW